jgi:hypothetical protein
MAKKSKAKKKSDVGKNEASSTALVDAAKQLGAGLGAVAAAAVIGGIARAVSKRGATASRQPKSKNRKRSRKKAKKSR